MAYVNEELLDDEDSQGGGAASAPSSAAPSSTQGPAQKSPSQIAQRGSGRFTNLGEYLRVNSPQQFGTQVAGKIGEDVSKGESALSSADTGFKSRVDAATVKDSGGLIQKVGESPETVNADQFAKLRDAQYGGPKSFADAQDIYGQTQGAVQTATGRAGASQTEGGRFALLDSYFGRPNYSQGQKTLDNLLVQGDPNAQQAFGEIRNRAATLNQNAKALSPQLNQYAAQGQNATQDTRDAARGAVNAPMQSLFDSAKTRASEAAAGNTAAYENARSMAQNNLTAIQPEFLQSLGLDPSVTQGYGTNAANYISPSSAPTTAQVLSPEELARARALQALSGAQGPFGDLSGEINPASPFSFDKDAYLKDRETNRSALNESYLNLDRERSGIRDALGGVDSRWNPIISTTKDANNPLWQQYESDAQKERAPYLQQQAENEARFAELRKLFPEAF